LKNKLQKLQKNNK